MAKENKSKDKRKVPKNIEDSVKEFMSFNGIYESNIFPFNNLISDMHAPQIYALWKYAQFKNKFGDLLELNTEQLTAFKKIEESLEDNVKEILSKDIQETEAKMQSINEVMATTDIGKVFENLIQILESSDQELQKLEESLDTFQENAISKPNKKIDTSKNPEEKIKFSEEIISSINNLENGDLKNSFSRKFFREVYYLPNALEARVKASEIEVLKNFQSFIKDLDKLIYYNFVLLNCQQLRFLGQKKMSQMVIDSKGLTESVEKEKGIEPLALVTTGKEVYNMVIPKYKESHPTLSKSLTKFIKNIKSIKPSFDKVTKLIYLIDMYAEELSPTEKDDYYTKLGSFLVASGEIVRIAVNLLFEECEISDNYDLNYYLSDESSRKHINALAVMLLTDIVRFSSPQTSLDEYGYYTQQGLLGLSKKYLSKADIYSMINEYKENKSRYSLSIWVNSLQNLSDNDVWDFEIRKHNNE